MAYPAYSIVVVETTTSGVTSTETFCFKTVASAKAVYKVASDAGKRVFLYESLEPTKFRRKDSQPFSTTS